MAESMMHAPAGAENALFYGYATVPVQQLRAT